MGKPNSLHQAKSNALLVLNQKKFCEQKDLRFKENKIKYQNNKKKKKTRIAPNQVFVPKLALKAQNHKNRCH